MRTTLILLLAALACSTRDVPGSDTTGQTKAAALPEATPVRITAEDFRRLRWIDGYWRGRMPDNNYFYERYRVLDDSTIVMQAFSDPTFTLATDSSRILLRGGVVSNDAGSAKWIATRFDTTGVDFAPQVGATNSFTWARESDSRWKATIRWTDQQGQPQTRTYAMQRLVPTK